MNLHRIALCLVCLMIAVVSWTCAKSDQVAATMVYEAKAQINAAKQEQAAELASDQLAEAEDYINKAEVALKDDSQEAYRLAKRAYLKARYAEVLAKRNKAERMAVIASSWVIAKTSSRPTRSVKLARSLPTSSCNRPDSSQSSAGCTNGILISWPPIAFISSRTICSILRSERWANGKVVYMPAVSCLIIPARRRS